MHRPAAALLALLATTASARADMAFTAQTRTVYAFATINLASPVFPPPAGATVKSAPDFAPWNDGVTMSVPADASTSTAAASMSSQVTPTQIAVSGGASGNDAYPFSGSGAAFGHSTAIVDFTIPESTNFEIGLAGSFSGPQQQSIFFSQVSLVSLPSNSSVVNHILPFLSQPGPYLFFQNVTLPAGAYRFTVTGYAGGAGNATSTGSVSFQGFLRLPAPGAAVALAGGLTAFGARRRR